MNFGDTWFVWVVDVIVWQRCDSDINRINDDEVRRNLKNYYRYRYWTFLRQRYMRHTRSSWHPHILAIVSSITLRQHGVHTKRSN